MHEETTQNTQEISPVPAAPDASAESRGAETSPDGGATTEVVASPKTPDEDAAGLQKRIDKLTARNSAAEKELEALKAENEQLKAAQLAKDAEAIRDLPVVPEMLEGDELSQLVAARKEAKTASEDADFWFGIASQGGGKVDGRDVTAEQAQAWARAADRKAGRAAATIDEISQRAKGRLSDLVKARRGSGTKPAPATQPATKPAADTDAAPAKTPPPPPAQGAGSRPEGGGGTVGRAPQTQEEAKALLSSGWGDDD